MKIYTTVQGDTWDVIAKKIYNDEMMAQLLMQENRELLHIFVFSSGIKVRCPKILPKQETGMPKWRSR